MVMVVNKAFYHIVDKVNTEYIVKKQSKDKITLLWILENDV